jgi:hypothetical protein
MSAAPLLSGKVSRLRVKIYPNLDRFVRREIGICLGGLCGQVLFA